MWNVASFASCKSLILKRENFFGIYFFTMMVREPKQKTWLVLSSSRLVSRRQFKYASKICDDGFLRAKLICFIADERLDSFLSCFLEMPGFIAIQKVSNFDHLTKGYRRIDKRISGALEFLVLSSDLIKKGEN